MFNNITGAEARRLLDAGAVLVDVRSPDEYQKTGLPGAINVPLHILPIKARELNPEKPLIVYCLSGGRSSQARALLTSMGFANVYNLGSFQNYHSC